METNGELSIGEDIIFKLISFSGDARSRIYEAYDMVKNGEYEKAEENLKKADEDIVKAHNVQTGLIHKEASGIHMGMSLLMVHAQDHLMNTLLARDLMKDMLHMQKEINELKKEAIERRSKD